MTPVAIERGQTDMADHERAEIEVETGQVAP